MGGDGGCPLQFLAFQPCLCDIDINLSRSNGGICLHFILKRELQWEKIKPPKALFPMKIEIERDRD